MRLTHESARRQTHAAAAAAVGQLARFAKCLLWHVGAVRGERGFAKLVYLLTARRRRSIVVIDLFRMRKH